LINGSFENRYFPIREGIGPGLHEVILTTEISKFLYDHDIAEEVAFVFTTKQLEEYGAVLQGINNAFVCHFNKKGLKWLVTKALSQQPFLQNTAIIHVQLCSAAIRPRFFMTWSIYAIESTGI
jgi:hypothetical protein